MPAPDSIRKLVETFEGNIEDYRSSKNETELRRQFLDPFFEALGWDVDNKKGASESEKEVAHEFSVEIEGAQKKADYAFRAQTGARAGRFDFLVEAKKPSVRIESNLDAAFQIKRYGWSAKIPVNILTDFEHFAVYDCRVKPKYGEKASLNRMTLIHFKEYVERWDEIVSIFSPGAIRKGSLNEYAGSVRGKRGTADVDDDFLQEIERWRDSLAKNIASNNGWVDIGGLNYAVQMLIDRIVFLRICEERSIEPENQLQDIANGEGVYKEALALFKRADTKYNSGLFHFSKDENQASRPDDLTPRLVVDDKPLKDIILNLYYPKSPYAFLYIPSDILGQVYERFLGKVIRLTEGHHARVEEKPEVKKAGGVFYTPTFIVEYIVANTLGKLLEGKTPREAAKLKIVDPACGSGTFLLGAYEYLLKWHLNWYMENDPEKWAGGKSPAVYQSVTYQRKAEAREDAEGRRVIREGVVDVKGEWRLTTAKKKQILLDNIFGVDIDSQAVEVTKLSLLLKVLEDLNGQLTLGMDRLLPDLGDNVKYGNSLVGGDYFDGRLPSTISGGERLRVNAFDWKTEFPQAFDDGGFDAVIGNPPYLFIVELEQATKDYYFKKYQTTEYRFDVYGLFAEQSVRKLLKEGGYLGFITPHTLLSNDSFTKLRRLLLSETFIDRVLDIGPGVFQGAKNETMVFVVRKAKPLENEMTKVVITDSWRFPDPVKEFSVDQKLWSENNNASWLVKVSSGEMQIISKIESANRRLGDLCTINQGVRTGDNEKYLGNKKLSGVWKPAAGGKHVGRYAPLQTDLFVYYDPKVLDAPRKPGLFSSPEKLVVQEIRNITLPRRIIAAFDDKQFYCLQSTNVINLRANVDAVFTLKYLLGILNSNCANYFFRQKFSGNNHIASNQLAQIPIPFADQVQRDKLTTLVETMLELHKNIASLQNPSGRERLERQIASTDREIDALVYQLYGLTGEEIKIVEG